DGSLAPEEQSGVEGGFDFLLGRTLAIEVTRFDQTASGLIQRVMTGGMRSGAGYAGSYQMQNVGQISNQGWEIQGSLRSGPLSLTGTYSLAQSRVRQLAA